MTHSRKNALRRLHEIAESQQGFFTTKQALHAGFSARSHLYHVQARDWIREYRGIYRLAQFPLSQHHDLMQWSLWSRNNQEEPEGVYSHETAMSLYDLSDLMPAKLHMTVPKDFRRNSKIPKILVLHYGDVPPTDIESMQGVKITRPLRSLTDILAEGKISIDFIEQAAQQAFQRGLITRSQIEKASLSPDHKAMLLRFYSKAA